jgi:hypothetical protein
MTSEQSEIQSVVTLLSDTDRKARIEQITAEILAERASQVQGWGEDFEKNNTVNDWVALIALYLGQAVVFPIDKEKFEVMMVKVAALAYAALEASMRVEGKLPMRHYDG